LTKIGRFVGKLLGFIWAPLYQDSIEYIVRLKMFYHTVEIVF